MAERTHLTPEEERQFQEWVLANGIRDVDHPDSHYDYRGYWKLHRAEPIRFGVDHFPDTFKQHGHPTFSVESQYSRGANDGGRWAGETFVPPAADLLATSRRPTDVEALTRAISILASRGTR